MVRAWAEWGIQESKWSCCPSEMVDDETVGQSRAHERPDLLGWGPSRSSVPLMKCNILWKRGKLLGLGHGLMCD